MPSKDVIPEHIGKIKNAMMFHLTGYPVKATEFGIRMSSDITNAEVIGLVMGLLEVEKTATVTARFRMGDMYNQLVKRKGARKEVVDAISAAMGKNYYQNFRTYAWVASKWPDGSRSSKYGWTYYLKHVPGEKPGEKKRKPDMFLTRVKDADLPEGVEAICFDSNGRRYLVVELDEDAEAHLPGACASALESTYAEK